MAKFTLELELGNAAMTTPDDVAGALEQTAERMRAGGTVGTILDANGNTVGNYGINAADRTRAHYIETASLVQALGLAMQAAWIEWKHGRGAEAAMGWIENTLDGPDQIPDATAGTDAQAFYDREIALHREQVRKLLDEAGS